MNQIARRLQAYCNEKFQGKHEVRVLNLENITTGWESEVYAFVLEHGQPSKREREELVLRVYAGEGAGEKSAREFQSTQHLREVGYPVPQFYVLEREQSPFGKPFVLMEKIDGQVLWSQIDAANETTRAELITQFCKLFARLHQLDWRLFVEKTGQPRFYDPYVFVDEWLGIARHFLEQFPDSGFRVVVEWLAERRDSIPCYKPSPTHNDFHPNNVLVQKDGSPIVIDWTGFQISDARFDLAWTLVLAEAYRGSAWRERILREYESFSGAQVDALDCFIVFACVRRLFDVTTSLLHGAEKMGMRADAVVAMKKSKAAHERVYQLLIERAGLRIKGVDEMLLSLHS
ncbi:MAG: phosphotransferase family protein [Chloroflexi bacterium]|nr:phosphotransferase family protein [Chloroflexota bacterium]